MLLTELFYSVFWVVCISVIWFYTDFVMYYCELLNCKKDLIAEYKDYIKEQPFKYFPDFLFYKFSYTDQKLSNFLAKLCSCPFCFIFWASIFAGMLCKNLILIAPIYVLSLIIILKIKSLI